MSDHADLIGQVNEYISQPEEPGAVVQLVSFCHALAAALDEAGKMSDIKDRTYADAHEAQATEVIGLRNEERSFMDEIARLRNEHRIQNNCIAEQHATIARLTAEVERQNKRCQGLLDRVTEVRRFIEAETVHCAGISMVTWIEGKLARIAELEGHCCLVSDCPHHPPAALQQQEPSDDTR